MVINVEIYFILFFIYSFLGWFMESVGGIFKSKKFVNRGFLIGPYCPVYGVGVVLLSLLLDNYKNDSLILFIFSIIICAILEYLTSYIMEKLFNARWWDYGNRKFNINGRICLETSLPFGFMGCLFVKIVNPFFQYYIDLIPFTILTIIVSILFVIIFIDFVVSFMIIKSFKIESKEVKDNTDEIVAKVKESTTELTEKIQKDTKKLAKVIKLNTLKLKHNVRYHSKRNLSKISTEKIKQILENRKSEFQDRIKANKFLLQYKIDNALEENLLKFKEKFKKKSKLHERLLKAFPNYDINKKK